MQNYLQFEFITENTGQSEQLVALLSELDFEGFEEKEDLLSAFIPERIFNEPSFNVVIQLFPAISYIRSSVENINWNQKWESEFEPVVVDNETTGKPWAAVRAGFHAPIANVEHEIVITPKMSFGTGHHATTYLVMQQMQQLDFTGKSVFDFGTGTGVLAILAQKLGAAEVLAIDNDEWSIENAKENVAFNHCNDIRVELASSIPDQKQYEIVLANINLNVITNEIKNIYNVLIPGGIVVFSGFFKGDEERIRQTITDNGLIYKKTVQKADWIAIITEK